MLFLRTRPSLSNARTVPKPDHLGPFGAGWRALSGSPHIPHTNAQLCAARQAWLRSRLLRSPQLPHRLQAPGSRLSEPRQTLHRLTAWRSARPYIGSVRRGLNSALSPLIPTGSAPSPILIRFSERADVREDSDPGKRTWMKSPTLHSEGTLASVGQHCRLLRTRRGWRKDGVVSEMKVRRCCSC